MKISEELETIVQFAREEAMRTGCYTIRPEHLMLGILRQGDNSAMPVLEAAGIETATARKAMEAGIFHEHSVPYRDIDSVRLSTSSDTVLNLATAKAIAAGKDETTAADLLQALAAGTGCCADFLSSRGCTSQSSPAGDKAPVISGKQLQALISALKTENNICS